MTGQGVAEVPGVTEVRAGTYVFNDAMQVGRIGPARRRGARDPLHRDQHPA